MCKKKWEQEKEGKERAVWIGRAASLANNLSEPPFKERRPAGRLAGPRRERKQTRRQKKGGEPKVIGVG